MHVEGGCRCLPQGDLPTSFGRDQERLKMWGIPVRELNTRLPDCEVRETYFPANTLLHTIRV